MAYPSDGTNRLFVSNKSGQIRVFQNSPNASSVSVFLDIESKVQSGYAESGLLSFAFDPAYSSNGYFYVHYNAASSPIASVISRFKVSDDDANAADASSEKQILRLEQPAANHNGGKMAFGSDGYLYIALGDGGNTPNRSQSLTNLFGSIIRIDPTPADDAVAYSIPSDNPFYNSQTPGVKREIWAYGLRNPWRFSFDRSGGALWAGDVGQNSFEEVNIIKKGRNYGWPIREGFGCYQSQNCISSGLEPPAAVYVNSPGGYVGDCSITGGYVYRGGSASGISDKYIYGDYCSGKIWALPQNGSSVTGQAQLLADTSVNIASFGEDHAGELYIMGPGGLYKLTANP